VAEQIGTMPCDNPACSSEMDVMQDKRGKFYTVCECGRNTRNTNKGQKLFSEVWEKYQNSAGACDDMSGLIIGEPPEGESEKPETKAMETEAQSNSKVRKIIKAFLYIGAAVGGWKLYDATKNK